MMTYSTERALAYQNLMRWHETSRGMLEGKSRHDADWILADLVVGAMPSDLMQPTPIELTAAEILRLICAIETSIETGNARKLFNGIPEIVTLANGLKLSVDTLEKMTESYPVSVKDKITLKHYTPDAGNDASISGARILVTDQQNEAILCWLRSNALDPLKLPVPPSGKSGVKKTCRDELCKKHKTLFSSLSVFDTAWDRLRSNTEIKDAK